MDEHPGTPRGAQTDDTPDADGVQIDEPVYVVTRQGARAIDRAAVDRFGIPSILLMENASRHLAEIVDGCCDEDAWVLVCAGTGNNGGDGLAAARHLVNVGRNVEVVLAGDAGACTPDTGTNLAIVRAMGVPIIEGADRAVANAERIIGARGAPPGVIVDALLGTGLDREVREPTASLVRWINETRLKGSRVVSADTPSGLDVDTGRELGACVQADITVTFCGLKPGFLTLGAQPALGDIIVVDIGAPASLLDEFGTQLHHLTEPGDDDPPAPERPGDAAHADRPAS